MYIDKRKLFVRVFGQFILDYISREKIEFYHGYDAGWEGGLDIAVNNKKTEKINLQKQLQLI